MTRDIILCGVGGQGVVSLAAVITQCAVAEGLHVKQAEVHGMAQRGGGVISHVRLGDRPVASNQIPLGTADLIISTEPLEALRHLRYLDMKKGICFTADTPVNNIPDYPGSERLTALLAAVPQVQRISAGTIAGRAGRNHMINMVMLGAASVHLPLSIDTIKTCILRKFSGKSGEFHSEQLAAFEGGREECLRG